MFRVGLDQLVSRSAGRSEICLELVGLDQLVGVRYV